MISALALAAALALSAEPARPPPRQAPPAPRPEGAQPAPPPLSAEDAEVVAHLELLQKLELLQDLPIVDTGDPEEPRAKDDGERR